MPGSQLSWCPLGFHMLVAKSLTLNLVLQQNHKGCHIMELLNSSNRVKTAHNKTEIAVAWVCNYKYGAE